MSAPLASYLRTFRKRSGFTQDEVAFLLGSVSGAKVSRYEQLARQPNLPTVFAYEVIFRAPVRNLFAGLYQKVEETTRARARLLSEKLNAAGPDRITARKLAVLQSLSSGLLGPRDERR
jgi:transcriptional regulator with XRE-family HTH domain